MSHHVRSASNTTTYNLPYSKPQAKAPSETPVSMSKDENKMLSTLARLNPEQAKAYFAANKEKAAMFAAADAAKFGLVPPPQADSQAVQANEVSANDPHMAGVSSSFTSEDLQDLMAMYDKACGEHEHTPGMVGDEVPTSHDAATHTGHVH